MILIPLKKAFIKATTYTTKSGKVVNRKAYTDRRIAKVKMPSNRVRASWRKHETHGQVLTRLQKKHHQLIEDAKEVLKHHEAIKQAHKSGDTHSEHGIHVKDHHHVLKQIKNIHANLEDSSQRIMLHQNHTELAIQKRLDRNKKKTEKRKKETTSDFIENARSESKKVDKLITKLGKDEWVKKAMIARKTFVPYKPELEMEWDNANKKALKPVDNKPDANALEGIEYGPKGKKKTVLKDTVKKQEETEKSIRAEIKKRGYVTFGDQMKLDKIQTEETEERIRAKIKERGYATIGDSSKLERIYDKIKEDIDKWNPAIGKHAFVSMNGAHVSHPNRTSEYSKMALQDATEKSKYLSKHDKAYNYIPRGSVYKKGTYDIARILKSESNRIKGKIDREK